MADKVKFEELVSVIADFIIKNFWVNNYLINLIYDNKNIYILLKIDYYIIYLVKL